MCMLLSFQRPPRLAGGDSSGASRSRSDRLPSGQRSLAHRSREGIPSRRAAPPRRGRVAGRAPLAGPRGEMLPKPRCADSGAPRRSIGGCRLRDPQARELALAELQHAAVERLGRDVERLGRQRLAVELDAALGQLAPRLGARAAERRRRSPRAGAASRRCAATTASAISSGICVGDEHAVEAGLGLLGGRSAPRTAPRARARGRAWRRAGRRRPGRARAEQQPVPGRESARPGSAASCRTSRPAAR